MRWCASTRRAKERGHHCVVERERATFEWKRAVLTAVIDHINIMPVGGGRPRLPSGEYRACLEVLRSCARVGRWNRAGRSLALLAAARGRAANGHKGRSSFDQIPRYDGVGILTTIPSW